MAEIDLTPTEEMAANAARGLELRRKHGKGGTEIGVARARDISNRKNLSPETVRRMHAFFSRHEKNKAGGEDDAGYIAWMLWSGDAGRDWAKRKVEQMNKGENQRSDTYKEIAQRLGSAAKFANEEAQMRELMGQLGQKPDKVIYKYGAFEMHFYGRAGKGDGEQRARRTLANLHAFMRRTGLDTHGAYYQPIDDRDPSQGGMIVLLASTFDKFSRPGAKAKMAMTPIRVTEAEYAALAARDAVSRKILGDSQYQITPSDRAIRAAGDAAYKTALARHNAWDKAWRDAPNDAARAEVEARAKAAEAGMRVYRGSRPGAKAKMGREKTVTVATVMSGTGGSGGLFKVVGYDENGREFEYGLFAMRSMAEQRAKDVARWKDWKYTASRPGAKVANAIREGEKVSASDDAVSRKIRKLMDEGKPQKQAVAIALDLERRGEL